MTMKTVRAMETALAKETIRCLLAAGFAVTMNDGEEDTVKASSDAAQILGAMFTTDEDYLIAVKGGKPSGWVRFIYGNDGYDVINDYTVNLEGVLAPVNKMSDRLEAGDFSITFLEVR